MSICLVSPPRHCAPNLTRCCRASPKWCQRTNGASTWATAFYRDGDLEGRSSTTEGTRLPSARQSTHGCQPHPNSGSAPTAHGHGHRVQGCKVSAALVLLPFGRRMAGVSPLLRANLRSGCKRTERVHPSPARTTAVSPDRDSVRRPSLTTACALANPAQCR